MIDSLIVTQAESSFVYYPIFWHWIPLYSVGPIVFGAHAAPIIEEYELDRLERDCEIADWDTYAFPHADTRVFVRDGRIEDVLCYDELFYEGHNILGMHIEELRDLLGPDDPITPDIGSIFAGYMARGEAAIYDHLGATFWLDSSTVNSATVGPLVEDD